MHIVFVHCGWDSAPFVYGETETIADLVAWLFHRQRRSLLHSSQMNGEHSHDADDEEEEELTAFAQRIVLRANREVRDDMSNLPPSTTRLRSIENLRAVHIAEQQQQHPTTSSTPPTMPTNNVILQQPPPPTPRILPSAVFSSSQRQTRARSYSAAFHQQQQQQQSVVEDDDDEQDEEEEDDDADDADDNMDGSCQHAMLTSPSASWNDMLRRMREQRQRVERQRLRRRREQIASHLQHINFRRSGVVVQHAPLSMGARTHLQHIEPYDTLSIQCDADFHLDRSSLEVSISAHTVSVHDNDEEEEDEEQHESDDEDEERWRVYSSASVDNAKKTITIIPSMYRRVECAAHGGAFVEEREGSMCFLWKLGVRYDVKLLVRDISLMSLSHVPRIEVASFSFTTVPVNTRIPIHVSISNCDVGESRRVARTKCVSRTLMLRRESEYGLADQLVQQARDTMHLNTDLWPNVYIHVLTNQMLPIRSLQEEHHHREAWMLLQPYTHVVITHTLPNRHTIV